MKRQQYVCLTDGTETGEDVFCLFFGASTPFPLALIFWQDDARGHSSEAPRPGEPGLADTNFQRFDRHMPRWYTYWLVTRGAIDHLRCDRVTHMLPREQHLRCLLHGKARTPAWHLFFTEEGSTNRPEASGATCTDRIPAGFHNSKRPLYVVFRCGHCLGSPAEGSKPPPRTEHTTHQTKST